MSWLTNYYMPFIQTPVNIAGTVAERTPFLHKYLSNYNQMIARGGKDAALAKARMRLGFSILFSRCDGWLLWNYR